MTSFQNGIFPDTCKIAESFQSLRVIPKYSAITID